MGGEALLWEHADLPLACMESPKQGEHTAATRIKGESAEPSADVNRLSEKLI